LEQLIALRTEQQEAVGAHAPLEEAKKQKQKALDDLQQEIKRTAVHLPSHKKLIEGSID
jgi:hypothetical protein